MSLVNSMGRRAVVLAAVSIIVSGCGATAGKPGAAPDGGVGSPTDAGNPGTPDGGTPDGGPATPPAGASDLFPAWQAAPALTTYVSGGVFKHKYYISPTGDDITGDGSIDHPWQSFRGADSGGSGTPVTGGDILYMRGGTYPTHAKVQWKLAYYDLSRSGSPGDDIVVTRYPGETPTFTGAQGAPSFSVHGSYVVIDGLTIADGGSFYFDSATHGVVQNCSFADCSDPWGDQTTNTCLGLGDNVSHMVIRNNHFGPTLHAHSIFSYTSDSVTSDVKVLYNRFDGVAVYYGTISQKGPILNWEYAYNRFQDCYIGIAYGATYNYAIDTGADIHDNAFDDVRVAIYRVDAVTGEVRGLKVHDNLILNGQPPTPREPGPPVFLRLGCDGHPTDCLASATDAMGEFYDNVLYGVDDAIDPVSTTNFVNYPSYWNYNAYRSTVVRDSAENRNNLPASSWEGSALVVPSNPSSPAGDIGVVGPSGNRFYYVPGDSPLRNKGRSGGTIGGFTWSP